VDGYYYWDAALPAGLTGRHVIYSVWTRSDSTETFYGCSDVVFDGGNGEVTF
jgi:chitin-binding protein